MVPAGTASSPVTATTQGMPSWRAMIAVWLVGPPSVVASATTRAGSRPAVSAGARSSAHRIDGTSGSGTPGSGRPLSSAMTRSRMSLQIGDAFGHQPAELGEQVDELLDRFDHGAHRRGAAGDALLGGADPGPVLGQRRGRRQHLRRRARRVGGPVTQPGGDGRGGRGEPRGLGGAVGFVDIAGRLDFVEGGQPAGTDHRGVLNAGHHRHTL